MKRKRILTGVLICTLCVICGISGGEFLPIKTVSTGNSEEKIEVVEFENKLPDAYKSSYYIDVYNSNSTDYLKETYTVVIEDENSPIYIEFAQMGSTSEVLMKIYFDFMPIEFKVEEAELSSEYVFEAQNGMKMKFPIYIGEDMDLSDKKTHKLFITFTSIPNEHISDYNQTTDFYGVNAIYNITRLAKSDYSDDLRCLSDSYVLPQNNYKESFGTFILNTDYDNDEYRSNRGVKIPEPSISAGQGSILQLMYNIDKCGFENVLLLLTVDYTVNNSKVVMLDGEEGTANGAIEIIVPEKSGLYEVIAYAIYDPFGAVTGENHLADCSYRFTLSVKS